MCIRDRRWAFWLNIPFGLLVLLGIVKALPETRDPSTDRHLDLVGALAIAVAMAGLVFALIEGATYGWWLQPSGSISPVPIVLAIGLAVSYTHLDVYKRQLS